MKATKGSLKLKEKKKRVKGENYLQEEWEKLSNKRLANSEKKIGCNIV